MGPGDSSLMAMAMTAKMGAITTSVKMLMTTSKTRLPTSGAISEGGWRRRASECLDLSTATRAILFGEEVEEHLDADALLLAEEDRLLDAFQPLARHAEDDLVEHLVLEDRAHVGELPRSFAPSGGAPPFSAM